MKTISRSSAFEFSFSQTLSVSITVEFEAGIPLLASTNVSATAGIEVTATQSYVKTETLTYGIDSEIEIPPNTSAHLLGNVDWLDNAVIPFKMIL